MTAEPDLLPSSVAAFTEALKGERGLLDAWLEVNDESEVAAHIEAYASARVARATAAKDAEVEALRALAGCAYQMAGFHDAPVVWLDRLSQAANGEKLPGPDTLSDELLPYQPDASSEIEALMAEVERVTCELMDAITRADKLAEALRERRDWFEAQAKSISKGNGPSWDLMRVREQRDLCDAALEQESKDA